LTAFVMAAILNLQSSYSVSCAARRVPTAQKLKTTTSLTVFTFLCTGFPNFVNRWLLL